MTAINSQLSPAVAGHTTIAQLIKRLAELPATAAVTAFHITWTDRNGTPNKIEYKHSKNE